MAKRLILAGFSFLLFPLVVLAQTSIVNFGGNITFSANALHARSLMIAYKNIHGSNLGIVTFNTGTLASGTVEAGATFNEGGSFVIIGDGNNGVPKGTIFRGRFTGTTTWTLVTSASNKHSYTLTSAIQSENGNRDGTVVELTINIGVGYFHKSAKLSTGSIALTP